MKDLTYNQLILKKEIIEEYIDNKYHSIENAKLLLERTEIKIKNYEDSNIQLRHYGIIK